MSGAQVETPNAAFKDKQTKTSRKPLHAAALLCRREVSAFPLNTTSVTGEDASVMTTPNTQIKPKNFKNTTTLNPPPAHRGLSSCALRACQHLKNT